MTDQVVTLRIVGENGNLVGVIRASKTELDGLGKSAGGAGRQVQGLAADQNAMAAATERNRGRLALLNGTLGQFKAILGGVALVQTIRDLARTSDAYTDINGKLAQVSKSERELASARAATFDISQRYYSQWESTVTLYGRVAQATDSLHLGQQKLAQIVETVNAGLLVSRASSEEAASAMLQLSQSFGSGVLRGEEFNAVYEAAPQLMKLLADSMNVPIGQLRQLAQDGKITVDKLVEAFTGAKARELQQRAAEVPLTISRAWQLMRNEVLKAVGEVATSTGTSSAIAAGVQGLGNNLGLLAKIAGTLALVLAGRLASAVAETTARFVANQVASTQAYLATMRLSAGFTTMQALTIRAAGGIRALGASLLSLAGGWIGAAVIAIGLLTSKFISARAEAAQLRQEVGAALQEGQSFLDTNDLNSALSAGKSLLAARQALTEQIANRAKNAAIVSAVSPGAAAAIYDTDAQRKDQAALAELNRQLALNATRINEVTAAAAAHRAEQQTGNKESKEFNQQLADQNEKLKVERIEREQGLRAALEYQAMQAAGVKTVGDLSQATRDLIDTQVREVTASDAYKQAQREQEKAARAGAKATDEQRDAQAKFTDALELARAELAGPLAKAQAEHDQAIRALDADYAKHNVTLAAYIGLKEVEDEKLRRTKDTIAASQDILGQINADYAQQLRLAGLSAEQYRVEAELIRRVNDAKQANVAISPELVAAWRQEITVGERQVAIAEASRRAAEDFQQSWLNAVDSVWRAMGDFITRGIHSWSDFGKELLRIGQRWVSDLIATWGRNGGLDRAFQRMLNGGYADAGTSGGGSIIDALAGASGNSAGGGSFLGNLVNSVVGGVGRFFGFGNGQSANGWSNAYGASGALAAGAGVLAPQYGGGALVGAAGGAGGMNMAAMLASFANSGTGKFLQSGYAPWLAGVGGALYGWQKGGDTPGKALGAAAYGTAAYGLATGVGAGLTASAAGAGVGAAGAAGLAAIPVVGWVALAAIAVNAISGGKLFGTKYKLDSASNSFTYGDSGIGGTQSVTKVKQQSLFRGRKWTTSTSALSDEAQAAMNEAFQAIDNAVSQAAAQLGVTAPDLIGASFKQEFDKKGNLKSEFGTIAGHVYKEAQDAFNQRYLAENLLNVAGLASGHAAAMQQLANGYRGSPEALTDFATLMLAIAGDAKAGKLLWDDTDAALVRAVDTLADLQRTGESLAQTYQRVSEAARAYGDLIGGVRTELLTHGLSDYAQAQLQIEQQYRAQVKQANDLAKALGLSGARAEDLAAIEQLRAQRMADLQLQMEKQRNEFLGTLRLSDLAPGSDQDKLTDAMQQLRTAVAGGDLQRAQQLAQTALGFGRNLYASGGDYNALYGTVTSLLEELDPAAAGLTADALQQLADTMETLPNDIASALFALLSQPAPVPPPPAAAAAPAPTTGAAAAPAPATGDTTAALQAIAASSAATAAGVDELLKQQKRVQLDEANKRQPA